MYYRARWYDPQLGRFISEDPIGFEGGINLYAYVKNKVINRKDARGLDDADKPWYVEDRPAPLFPSMSCSDANWGFVGAIGDFFNNYTDMIQANFIDSDKFFHCMANCEAAHRGAQGRWIAYGTSELREIFDERIKGDPRAACDEDRVANNVGRLGGRGCRPCSDVCFSFMPPGLPYPVQYITPPHSTEYWNTHSWGGGGRGW
jgi:uncharacterized protein RhaS with RHS repeats